ncbi:SDR family oxidoreductase [Chitinophagaceae bacterium LB-8]|uniref:SDR family oxidoreductase n=1 Tax=Paraflavisolibacter caeni TaxID=2982496 RepID=A0A9X2XVH6_9BACT|nr:SDR family NAD(P)-dependent oxidoreductase [Paraflavisolibacter caeni]MCU7549735.1 SDR family oxidoreductase [Paraflavisolibacter caeni]
MNSLKGKIALVTGGAGGIGSAICKKLACEGASVVVTYNSKPEKAKQLLNELPGDNHNAFHAPVHDSDALKKLSTAVAEQYGSLDILINNAGITTPVAHDDLEGLTDEWIDRIFTTNFRGSFAMIRACKDLLMKSGNGLVVNISSVAGVTGIGSSVAYCASKAAIDSMTRSLARALAPQIRVVSVSPGWVLGEYTSSIDPAYLQKQLDATPLNRLATPEDVADAVYAVATVLTFSTGCIIPVDGGRPLMKM